MPGRPRTFNEEEIIGKATLVFWKKGYEAASAEELLKAMGIGKGSFYLHFKNGKRELYQKCLEQFARESIKRYKNELEKSSDKIGFLKSLFYKRLALSDEKKYYGCYVGNALVEMANMDEEMHQKASEHLQKLEMLFYEVIKEAKIKNQITSAEPPEIIAKHLVNLWNGMNISKRMKSDEKVLRQVVDMNLKILD